MSLPHGNPAYSSHPFPHMQAPPRTAKHTVIDPPPSYRSEDAWSSVSTLTGSASGMGQRRRSWQNLVDSDANTKKYKANQYPRVQEEKRRHHQSTGAIHVLEHKVSGVPQATPVFHARPPSVHISEHGYQVYPKGSVMGSAPPSHAPSIVHIASKTPSMQNMQSLSRKNSDEKRPKRNRMRELEAWCGRTRNCFCCLALGLLLIVGIVLAIVLPLALKTPKTQNLSWLAPDALRAGQNQANAIRMTTQGEQLKFALRGQMPFKNDYISYYDFHTNKVVVVDGSLKSSGKNLACFVMDMDRNNLADIHAMQKAAQKGKNHRNSTTGWQETWLLTPAPISPGINASQFTSQTISECEGARWIRLERTSIDQQKQQCSDCYDFCLPAYGIDQDSSLSMVRRDCFHLFVPEWRTFAQANTIEQNQRDFEQFYRTRANGGGYQQPPPLAETKWIPLGGMQSSSNSYQSNRSPPAGSNNQMGQFGQSVQNTVGQAGQQMNAFGNSVQNGVQNEINNLQSGFQNGMNRVQNGVQSGMNGLQSGVQQGVQAVQGGIDTARSGLVGMGQAVQQGVNTFGNTMQNGYSNGNSNGNSNYGDSNNQNNPSRISGVVNLPPPNVAQTERAGNTGLNAGWNPNPAEGTYGSQGGYYSQQHGMNPNPAQSGYGNVGGYGNGYSNQQRPEQTQQMQSGQAQNGYSSQGVNSGSSGSGYVPDVVQGIAGVEKPAESRSHGYTPDVVAVGQNGQGMQQYNGQMNAMAQQQQTQQPQFRTGWLRA